MLLRGEAINLAYDLRADAEALGHDLDAGDETVVLQFFEVDDPDPSQAFVRI